MTLLSCRVMSLLALSLSTGRFSFVNMLSLLLVKASAFILVEELCIYTLVCYRLVVLLYIGARVASPRLLSWTHMILMDRFLVVLRVLPMVLPSLAWARLT